jgi:hypothetical protein
VGGFELTVTSLDTFIAEINVGILGGYELAEEFFNSLTVNPRASSNSLLYNHPKFSSVYRAATNSWESSSIA